MRALRRPSRGARRAGRARRRRCAPHLARVSRDLAEALLDPPALRLERELLGVAVRQRRLDRVEARRAGPVLGQVLSSSAISSRSGMTPDYRMAKLTSGMGRTAHLWEPTDPSRLTFAASLEKWKGRAAPSRRRNRGDRRLPARARRAGRVAQRVPARSSRGALRAPHVSPAQTGAIVLDLRTGQTVFAHNTRAWRSGRRRTRSSPRRMPP